MCIRDRWQVIEKKSTKPKFKKAPIIVEYILNPYGCGDEIYTVFDFQLEGQKEVLFMTELVELESNNTQLAYITEQEGKIKVGKGMCSGAFWYSWQNKKCKLRFRIVDSAGNYSENWTNWIEFEKPKYSR